MASAADRAYVRALRLMVLALAGVSGLAVITMIIVTCADVAMRICGSALTGSFDIVRMAGLVAIAGALPYTTAVKGHVAIEFFFQKLNRPGRILVDTVCRLLVIILLAGFAWQSVIYGSALHRSGEVSLTLKAPVFWLAYVIAFSCAVTVLVKIHNLLHPGREMIRP